MTCRCILTRFFNMLRYRVQAWLLMSNPMPPVKISKRSLIEARQKSSLGPIQDFWNRCPTKRVWAWITYRRPSDRFHWISMSKSIVYFKNGNPISRIFFYSRHWNHNNLRRSMLLFRRNFKSVVYSIFLCRYWSFNQRAKNKPIALPNSNWIEPMPSNWIRMRSSAIFVSVFQIWPLRCRSVCAEEFDDLFFCPWHLVSVRVGYISKTSYSSVRKQWKCICRCTYISWQNRCGW